jgi:hypothetical protein
MPDDRQPFADELKDDAYFATALKDDAHFDPASFQPQPAPPAQGGGTGVPFWMQGHDTPVDPAKIAGVGVDKEGPKDMGDGTIPGGHYSPEDAYKAVESATAANDVLQKQKQEDMGGRIKDLQSTMEDMRKNKPPVLERNKPPPKADFSASSMAYMQVAALMGALAGGFSRRGTTTALKAFSGMMQGLHDGNVESFQQMHQEWKEAEQNVNDVNQAKLDEYNAVWKDQKTNIDQKMEMMKLVATKYDDQITYNTAKMHDFTKLAEFQQKERDHHDERLEKSQKMMKDMELLDGRIKAQHEQEMANYDDAADRFVKGDKNARTQAIGRGGASAATNWNAAVQRAMQRNGLSNDDVMANAVAYDSRKVEAGTIARRGGQIAVAADEVARLLPQLQALSAASPGKGNSIWNAGANRWDVVTGDKNYQKMVSVMNGMLTSYGTVLARGGQSTDATRAKAHETLNPNMPQSARQGAFEGIAIDINAARQAVVDAREEVRTGKFEPVQVQGAPSSGGKSGSGKLRYDPATGTLINAD